MNVVALVLSLFAVALVVPGEGRTVLESLEYSVTLLPALAVFAVILTVLQRYLHPLLVVLFGKLVLRTFGLFLLLIDMLVFVVTVYFTPLALPLHPEAWWGIPVATVVFDAFSFILVTLVGLNRPWPGDRGYEGLWQILGDRKSVV